VRPRRTPVTRRTRLAVPHSRQRPKATTLPRPPYPRKPHPTTRTTCHEPRRHRRDAGLISDRERPRCLLSRERGTEQPSAEERGGRSGRGAWRAAERCVTKAKSPGADGPRPRSDCRCRGGRSTTSPICPEPCANNRAPAVARWFQAPSTSALRCAPPRPAASVSVAMAFPMLGRVVIRHDVTRHQYTE
jgi:hypothetical protein